MRKSFAAAAFAIASVMLAGVAGEPAKTDMADFDGLPLDEAVSRLERRLISRALDRADGVQSRAAELLGTTRRILKYKMDQLGISDSEL